MATLVLAAADSALGGAVSGQLRRLDIAGFGQGCRAALGSIVDQRLLGAGAEPVGDRQGSIGSGSWVQARCGAAPRRRPDAGLRPDHLVQPLSQSSNTQNVGGKEGQAKSGSSATRQSCSCTPKGEVSRIGRIWGWDSCLTNPA